MSGIHALLMGNGGVLRLQFQGSPGFITVSSQTIRGASESIVNVLSNGGVTYAGFDALISSQGPTAYLTPTGAGAGTAFEASFDLATFFGATVFFAGVEMVASGPSPWYPLSVSRQLLARGNGQTVDGLLRIRRISNPSDIITVSVTLATDNFDP